LEKFETALLMKLKKIAETTSGITIEIGDSNHHKTKSTKLFMEGLNIKSGSTPMGFVSPKAQFTMRGKTAQTGRAADCGETLPDIRYDRSTSNNRNALLG
jgi:hypothetical protein